MQRSLVPDAVAAHPGCVLIKLGQVAFRHTERQLSELGLRTRHYTVLKVLAADGAMPQQQLSRHCRIDPTTIVAAVDDLETQQLATRTRDSSDRRRSIVTITDHGRDIVTRADALLDTLNNELLADLTPEQTTQLIDVLHALNGSAALTDLPMPDRSHR